MLVSSFLATANKPGIEAIDSKIEATFITRAANHRPAIRTQLMRWVQTQPHGRYADAIPHAKALYKFLFPHES